jgi:hypothetical protein
VKGKRTLVAAFIAIAISGVSSTATAEWVVGRYAGEFLSLGAGARALAMGGASVARPTPSAAVFYNPSALADVEKRHAEFMHASQFDNLYTYDYLSFAGRLRGGQAAGVTLLYTRVSNIPMTRLADPNQPLSDNNRVVVEKETGDHELALLAGTGRMLKSGWRGGASAKLLYKSVAGESAFGLGFDLGASKTLPHGFAVGLAARDVTTSVLAWTTGRTEAILPSLAAGGAWSADLHAVNARISLAADLDGHFESRGAAEQVEAGPLTVEPRVGLEYLVAHTVALRGGINGNTFTAGAGLCFRWLSVQAAFQNHTDLGLTHRVSVNVDW